MRRSCDRCSPENTLDGTRFALVSRWCCRCAGGAGAWRMGAHHGLVATPGCLVAHMHGPLRVVRRRQPTRVDWGWSIWVSGCVGVLRFCGGMRVMYVRSRAFVEGVGCWPWDASAAEVGSWVGVLLCMECRWLHVLVCVCARFCVNPARLPASPAVFTYHSCTWTSHTHAPASDPIDLFAPVLGREAQSHGALCVESYGSCLQL